MADISFLEQKIKLLEERVARLEDNRELMDTFYEKAKELAVNHSPLTAIYLQKKLLIDFPRAKVLLSRLQSDGII